MWAGTNYDGSYAVVLLLIIPGTISLIQNIGIEIQRAKDMHKFRSWVYFGIALANLGISIPLVRMFGEVGGALGTAIAIIIGNGFVMNWYNHVKVGLDMKFFWKQILSFTPALILPISAGVLMNTLFDLYNLLYFLGLGILYVIIFSVSMWFFGMNQYEKDLLQKPIKRISVKLAR